MVTQGVLSPLGEGQERYPRGKRDGALVMARSTMNPLPLPRRGLSRPEAAAYVGISPCKFDQLIADGRMPGARRIDGRKVWDVRELDLSFDDLPRDDSGTAFGSSWDDR